MGHGQQNGRIPSAFGGRTIKLSHAGKIFETTETNLSRWRGWLRVIHRDQFLLWLPGCLLGMALPAMFLSVSSRRHRKHRRKRCSCHDGGRYRATPWSDLLVSDAAMRVRHHGSYPGEPIGPDRTTMDGRALDCLAAAAQGRGSKSEAGLLHVVGSLLHLGIDRPTSLSESSRPCDRDRGNVEFRICFHVPPSAVGDVATDAPTIASWMVAVHRTDRRGAVVRRYLSHRVGPAMASDTSLVRNFRLRAPALRR